MIHYVHVSGAMYRIMEGVRRANAARLSGHDRIPAEVVDPSGQSLRVGELPIEALRSPKTLIRRITLADETRWQRAVAGAQQAVLPYPPIVVEPSTEQGTRIDNVDFDFGSNP
jgi:hypothetical protein